MSGRRQLESRKPCTGHCTPTGPGAAVYSPSGTPRLSGVVSRVGTGTWGCLWFPTGEMNPGSLVLSH